MSHYRSEDIELPNYEDEIEKQENNEEDGNKKKNIIIVIIVVGGVLILGVIIFLVIYYSTKNKRDGGIITIKHELEDTNEVTIFNLGNFKDDEYSIEVIKNETVISGRLLEENIYDLSNGVLKFYDNKIRVGIIECKIKFNNILTRIDGMFKDIKSLISADFSEFNSEKVKNMDSLFLNCENLQNTKFNNFNSKKVESMNNAFESCINLYEIDLSSFETPKLRSMKKTFKDCKNLEYIDLKKFELNNNIVDREYAFDGDDNLKYINVDNSNTKSLLMGEIKNLSNSNNTNYDICEEGKDEKCQKCNENGNQCSLCNEGYFWPNNIKINKCKKCYKNCKSCTDYMKCTKCINYDKYELKDNICVIKTIDTTSPTTSITTSVTTSNAISDATSDTNSYGEVETSSFSY